MYKVLYISPVTNDVYYSLHKTLNAARRKYMSMQRYAKKGSLKLFQYNEVTKKCTDEVLI